MSWRLPPSWAIALSWLGVRCIGGPACPLSSSRRICSCKGTDD